jgi:hypothetical protein
MSETRDIREHGPSFDGAIKQLENRRENGEPYSDSELRTLAEIAKGKFSTEQLQSLQTTPEKAESAEV